MASRKGIQSLLRLSAFTLESIKKKYPASNPETNLYDIYRAHLSDTISNISGIAGETIYPLIQWTPGVEKGDFVLPVPALRIKDSNPNHLAAKWATEFSDDSLLEKPRANGSFMAFFLKPQPLLQSVIPMVRELAVEYGRDRSHGLKDPRDLEKGKKRIIVEFSSPNIAKPFHAGHLRSTIIGGFLANLYEAAGWEVIKMNYLGDWGKQYGLLALAFEEYGNEEQLREDPINHLFQIYVRISHEQEIELKNIQEERKKGEDVSVLEADSLDEQARHYFKRMTDRDETALLQWRHFRDLSITRYKDTYSRLNIHFDEYRGESQVSEDSMKLVAQRMAEKGISQESDGAMIVDFSQHIPGKEGKRLEKPVIRKKDGTALYLTRDISELLGRFDKYNFDKMIYVVASAQDLHLQQLFKIVKLLGHEDISQRCQHINFGLVRGMSTRKGTVKFLDDILRDCGDHMHEVMRKNEKKYAEVSNPTATADILGISSVMVQDMTGKRINDYTFDLARMTSFEGDTGPYIQYASSRLSSIKRRAGLTDEELVDADLSLLTEPHAINIVRMLGQWPDSVRNAMTTLEPTTILSYLFRLTHVISSSYNHLQVIGSEPDLMKARMALYDAARIVLTSGMRLLGLSPLERM